MSDVTVEHIKSDADSHQVSDFLCKEMLYEHLEGTLQGHRKTAVDRYIESSLEAQDEYRRILNGVEFCQEMKESVVRRAAIESIRSEGPSLEKILGRLHWKWWPSVIKSFTQAVSIAVLTAFIITLLPWQKLPLFSEVDSDKTIELVQLNLDEATEPVESPALKTGTPVVVAKNEIVKIPAVVKKEQKEKIVPTKNVAKSSKKSVKKSVEPPVKKAKKETQSKSNVAVAVAAEPKVKQEAVRPVKTVKKKNQLKGFVFRVFMDIEDVDRRSQLISKKIRSLGGKKAGKVDLGWKTKGGRYFNFKISDKGYEELVTYLRTFGPIRSIKKDSHKIVMPKGFTRSVLWIEEVKKKK